MPTPIKPFTPIVSGASGALRSSRGRERVATVATVRLEGEQPLHVNVRNISEGGLMAELATPLAVNTALEVEVPGLGSLTGRVAWQTAGRTGIAFDELVDPRRAYGPGDAIPG